MTQAAEVQVSIAEIYAVCITPFPLTETLQVRGCALESFELLALAVSAADVLPPCPKGTVFDADSVFITLRGTVVVSQKSTAGRA